MTRAPDWSEEEFILLVSHSETPPSGFGASLPRRSPEAIQVVRNGLHEFHEKGESTLLSQLMVRLLTESGISWTCPKCGAAIQPKE